MRNFLPLMLMSLLPIDSSAAPDAGSAARTTTHIIESKVLGERRVIDVRLPSGYAAGASYPVVYVLDGEWAFDLVASYVDYHVREGLFPPVIVTAVRNVNRNRDYVAEPDRHFPYTGGAAAFVDFVAEEWRGLIADRYGSDGPNVLLGHSFGGTFTLYALFTRAALFDAYIALSASTWVSERFLFDAAERYFSDHPRAAGSANRRFVYMAVGENDGGPTVPDGKALAAVFEARAPKALEWYFEIHPRTEHFLNFTAGLHAGFQRLFPHWEHDRELMARARADGVAGVEQWFAMQQETLGWRFRPAWFDLGVVALRLRAEDRHAAAVAIVDMLRRWHGRNPNLLAMAGEVYRAAGDLTRAEQVLQLAIEEAIAQREAPNAIQLPRLERALERVREQREDKLNR